MTTREALIAVLREWPGTEERLRRVARKHGFDHYETDLHHGTEYFRRWRDRVKRFLGEWAQSFMDEPVTRLTDEELSIRHAMQERLVLECDGQSKSNRENVACQLWVIEHEMAKRAAKAGV